MPGGGPASRRATGELEAKGWATSCNAQSISHTNSYWSKLHSFAELDRHTGFQRDGELLQHLAALRRLRPPYLHAELAPLPVKLQHAKGGQLDKAAVALYPQARRLPAMVGGGCGVVRSAGGMLAGTASTSHRAEDEWPKGGTASSSSRQSVLSFVAGSASTSAVPTRARSLAVAFTRGVWPRGAIGHAARHLSQQGVQRSNVWLVHMRNDGRLHMYVMSSRTDQCFPCASRGLLPPPLLLCMATAGTAVAWHQTTPYSPLGK